jgi:NAD(P)-dependent dehydrogenase (short-subunit alcohol dehydrogenase family)
VSRSWLITGCSTGFGRLLSQKLLDRGERVTATARDVSSLDGLVCDSSRNLLRAALDVTDEAQIREVVTQTVEAFGGIDVLVNNAGYGYFAWCEDGDIDEIRRMFETNVYGLMRMTQSVLPVMREQRRGVIVNLSSIAGRVSFPRAGFYNASKWAVEGFSEALFHEVQPFGLRVVVIQPGAYETDFASRSAVRSPSLVDKGSPYASLGDGWTVAAQEMMPVRQDPMEVVDRILKAVDGPAEFARIPSGQDATSLIGERDASTDGEFIRSMSDRYARHRSG